MCGARWRGTLSDLTLHDGRFQSRARRGAGWLELLLFGSLAVHALLLAIIIFARHFTPTMVVPEPQGFALVWEKGQRRPDAVPAPGRHISIPAAPAPSHSAPVPQPAPTPERERSAELHEQSVPRANPFAAPMHLDFTRRPHPATPRGMVGSRSLNLAMGLLIQGGQLKEVVPHVSSPGANGEYLEILSEYVESHKYYPERAAQNGEDGVSVIKITITRDGTVKDVGLVETSGSHELDLAWMSLFRDQHLPPFPDDMPEAQRSFTISMDYILLRQ